MSSLIPDLMEIVIDYAYPPKENIAVLEELESLHRRWECDDFWGWSFIHWLTVYPM